MCKYLCYVAMGLLGCVIYSNLALAQNHLEHTFKDGFAISLPADWRYNEKNVELSNTYFIANDWQNEHSLAVMEVLRLAIEAGKNFDDLIRQQLNQLASDTLNYGIMADEGRYYPLQVPYRYAAFGRQQAEPLSDTYTQLLFVQRGQLVWVVKLTTTTDLLASYNSTFHKIMNSFALTEQYITCKPTTDEWVIPPSFSAMATNDTSVLLLLFPTAELQRDTVSASITLASVSSSDSLNLDTWVANENLELMLTATRGQIPTETELTWWGKKVHKLNFLTTLNNKDVLVQNYYWQTDQQLYVLSASCITAQQKATDAAVQYLVQHCTIR